MMTFATRLLYLGYYVRKLHWLQLRKFMAYVKHTKGYSSLGQWRRIFRDSLRFNISILEYYQFRFFELSDVEKATWAGTGTMYEFQKQANPPKSRGLLNDKRKFYLAYKQFFRHEMYSLNDLRMNPDALKNLLANHEKLVFKQATGNCGEGVSFLNTIDLTTEEVLSYMQQKGFDLVETFVQQHEILNRLSPSAVNTVRIFTQLRQNGCYEILGARLRISVDSPVDNLAAGNLAAPIDLKQGLIDGPGVYSDITKGPERTHPITGSAILGLQVPYWNEILAMIWQASRLHPENRSVGWDVVVTDNGPGLLEGNHDWCKLVWQLPVRRGLKHMLDNG